MTNGRFNARWQVLDLNRDVRQQLVRRVGQRRPALQECAFGVDLVQPVDLYLQAERSVKYAGLFIALSLLTLFVWEHLARRPLHPIQYGLMALALSVFYLLLLALAEHVGFIASCLRRGGCALCGLLGILPGRRIQAARLSGSGAGAVFAGVYALLYLLVTSEDYSLARRARCSRCSRCLATADGADAPPRLVPRRRARAAGGLASLSAGRGWPRVSTMTNLAASAITSGMMPSQNSVRTMMSLDAARRRGDQPDDARAKRQRRRGRCCSKAPSPSRAAATETAPADRTRMG